MAARTMLLRAAAGRRSARGVSLIELLVAMALGLIVVLAVMSMLVVGEANRRTTTGTNDMTQTGGFTVATLDRALRSAGAGFAQGFDWGVMGCKLHAARNGTNVLPVSAAFPAPFAGLLGGATDSADLRLAPVLIGQGQSQTGSDILVTMGGSAALGDLPRLVRGNAGTQKILLDNTLGLQANDVLLISAKSAGDCVVTQVDGTFTPPAGGTDTLPLAGLYFRANTTSSSLAGIAGSADAYMTALGNQDADNLQMQMFGVGTGGILYRYDLLRSTGSSAAEPLAEGVYALRALYAVDSSSTPDGVWDGGYVAPTGDYTIKTLMKTPDTQRRIVGVRVAMLVRSPVYEKTMVSPATYVLFSDQTALKYTINLSDDDRHYRYRVIDTVVPLRNLLMKQPAS
ncbi:PilW family protein [Pseudacidovorax sp. 1753]|uniref:PilW family protein n=1 Tax=Pseudacidovorax sp. 1753 TaxID=3156419 RepID=UPI003393C9EA